MGEDGLLVGSPVGSAVYLLDGSLVGNPISERTQISVRADHNHQQ